MALNEGLNPRKPYERGATLKDILNLRRPMKKKYYSKT